MKKVVVIFLMAALITNCHTKKEKQRIDSYSELNEEILKGWNTWDNRSVMTHVLLPDGLAIILQIKDTISGDTLEHSFIGNKVPNTEIVRVTAHTPDASYTEMDLEWRDFGMKVRTTAHKDDIDILITPDQNKENPGIIKVKSRIFYNRQGKVTTEKNQFLAELPGKKIAVTALGNEFEAKEDYIPLTFSETTALSTKQNASINQVKQNIKKHAQAYNSKKESYGDASETWDAIQNALYWNVVYDPVDNRAVTPVARTWAYGWGNSKIGGYVLFCWDNYFASYMHAIESKEMAFNEAIVMTRIIDELGFVPNYYGPYDIMSKDRSQPPVGSMMIEEIYKIYPEKWFLEEVFDRLMIWNRWWDENRNWDGYLCWGSNEFEVPGGDRRMLTQHNFKAASNESGLDNTPMYDGVPFDKEKNMLAIADAGLMGLYIGDCKALVKIAQELGRDSEVQELKKRIKNYSAKLEELWSEEEGLYLNKHMYSGELSHRISPTNFYPLIAEVPSQAQAERMINEHLLNPDEFWGEWVLPSISRNDTAYTGKEYWRGSIWAPMNFLVYYGMRNYDLTQSTDSLVQKSKELLLKEWNDHGFVRENYHAETGGHPGSRSENFYHWGALLGMPELMEKELVD